MRVMVKVRVRVTDGIRIRVRVGVRVGVRVRDSDVSTVAILTSIHSSHRFIGQISRL